MSHSRSICQMPNGRPHDEAADAFTDGGQVMFHFPALLNLRMVLTAECSYATSTWAPSLNIMN